MIMKKAMQKKGETRHYGCISELFSQCMETKNAWEYENMVCFSFINYFNTYSLISGATFISNLTRNIFCYQFSIVERTTLPKNMLKCNKMSQRIIIPSSPKNETKTLHYFSVKTIECSVLCLYPILLLGFLCIQSRTPDIRNSSYHIL